MRFPATMLLCLATLASLPAVYAQDHETVPDPEEFTPIPLYTVALGDHTYPISTRNAEAQAFFDQGFQMMYSFTKVDAARSFREAQRLDPDCAICYWGEAWAWGSYLNGPMPAEDSPRA